MKIRKEGDGYRCHLDGIEFVVTREGMQQVLDQLIADGWYMTCEPACVIPLISIEHDAIAEHGIPG